MCGLRTFCSCKNIITIQEAFVNKNLLSPYLRKVPEIRISIQIANAIFVNLCAKYLLTYLKIYGIGMVPFSASYIVQLHICVNYNSPFRTKLYPTN